MGGGLADQQVPGQGGQLREHRPHVLPGLIELGQLGQGALRVLLPYRVHNVGGFQVPGQAQGFQHRRPIHLPPGYRALVQQRQSVPQGPVRQPGQQRRSVLSQVDVLPLGHRQQPVLDLHRQNALKGEALAPGEDGGGHLVELRGRQDKDQMLRRLLQNFQQGVKGRHRQHVDLVHDIHPPAHGSGCIDRLVPEGPDLVHTIVGGRVQLHYVQNRTAVDAHAGGTHPTGVALHWLLAVDGFGQDFGAGGLARPPGAGKQVGVGEPVIFDLIF